MKLHLGCGDRCIPGWTHIDIVDRPHIDICHRVDRLPMLLDGSVDVIYACHVLEHFLRSEILNVLTEWRRILKPGGLLRVSVPDFDALVRVYSRTQCLENILGPLFGRQDYTYNYHYMVFNRTMLSYCLTSAGFREPRLYDWRATEHADVDDYSQAYWPHMAKDDPDAILISLNMEATA